MNQRVLNVKRVKRCVLPFTAAYVRSDCCQGIKYNCGLFTQCMNARVVLGEYCESCDGQARRNKNGKPNNGTVIDRMSVGLYEYKSPRGLRPILYTKVLEKFNINELDAIQIANKLDIVLDAEHFVMRCE